MRSIHVLDANALTAFIEDEEGADFVENLFHSTKNKEIVILMHKINLIEVLYHVFRKDGMNEAMKVFHDIKLFPINIINDITYEIMFEASRLKANYKLSLADSIGLATSIIYKGFFVTSDYHELEIIEKKEKLNILWFRPKK